MPDNEESYFPDWNKPATKGDVLTGMIWTQGLAVRVANMAFAASRGDQEAFKDAADLYFKEYDNFAKKISEIAGRR